MFDVNKNEKSRKAIIAAVREIKNMRELPMSIFEQMQEVHSLLGDSTPNKSRATKKVDDEIMKILADIKTDLLNGKSEQASVKCKQLIEKVKERNNSNSNGGNVDWNNDTKNAVCPYCKNKYIGKDKYCRYCGVKMSNPIYIPYGPRACIYGPMPTPRTHTCKACGYKWTTTLMVDDESFCPECGGEAPYSEAPVDFRTLFPDAESGDDK